MQTRRYRPSKPTYRNRCEPRRTSVAAFRHSKGSVDRGFADTLGTLVDLPDAEDWADLTDIGEVLSGFERLAA